MPMVTKCLTILCSPSNILLELVYDMKTENYDADGN